MTRIPIKLKRTGVYGVFVIGEIYYKESIKHETLDGYKVYNAQGKEIRNPSWSEEEDWSKNWIDLHSDVCHDKFDNKLEDLLEGT